jgi:hypothetical protein
LILCQLFLNQKYENLAIKKYLHNRLIGKTSSKINGQLLTDTEQKYQQQIDELNKSNVETKEENKTSNPLNPEVEEKFDISRQNNIFIDEYVKLLNRV